MLASKDSFLCTLTCAQCLQAASVNTALRASSAVQPQACASQPNTHVQAAVQPLDLHVRRSLLPLMLSEHQHLRTLTRPPAQCSSLLPHPALPQQMTAGNRRQRPRRPNTQARGNSALQVSGRMRPILRPCKRHHRCTAVANSPAWHQTLGAPSHHQLPCPHLCQLQHPRVKHLSWSQPARQGLGRHAVQRPLSMVQACQENTCKEPMPLVQKRSLAATAMASPLSSRSPHAVHCNPMARCTLPWREHPARCVRLSQQRSHRHPFPATKTCTQQHRQPCSPAQLVAP